VRDFLLGSRSLLRVAEAFRDGTLTFKDVEVLVGDSADSVLFRLKERCHALFRGAGTGVAPEAVFDIAVGALFHEAMKFRENFYQQAVYAPKLLSLESRGDDGAARLLEASRELLAGSKDRSEGVLRELTRWHRETTHQFETLVTIHRDNAYVTRFLIEHRELAEEALGAPLEALLSRFWGDPESAYRLAGRSFLEGGHFEDALTCFERAGAGGDGGELDRWRAYARGMTAYLASRFEDAVCDLGVWCRDPGADASFANLAQAALIRAGEALEARGEVRVAAQAKQLAEQVRAITERID
ncbi:MAG: hypothetical protein HKP27_15705, partial [Myxococcales bacterium]|nr:hypothetical protein [Myxococcales bacterium]